MGGGRSAGARLEVEGDELAAGVPGDEGVLVGGVHAAAVGVDAR